MGWLKEVDLLRIVDAGVKELFPPEVLAVVPTDHLQDAMVKAFDYAFEEQGYSPLLWEKMQGRVVDKKSRKKVFAAFENGRKVACEVNNGVPGDFISSLIHASINQLVLESKGLPESMLTERDALYLIYGIIQ